MNKKIINQLDESIISGILNKHPYSHIYCDNIFQENEYLNLLNNFPPKNLFGTDYEKNNYAILLGSSDLVDDKYNFNAYQDLIDFICSKDFFLKITKKLDLYDFLNNELQINLNQVRIVKESEVIDDDYDFLVDCNIGINTPNKKVSTVRGAHVDNTKVLYTGMLYLKDVEDNSEGADFIIYDSDNKFIQIDTGRSINPSQVEKCKTIPYKGNNMIVFANGSNSIHGVSPRGISKYSRKFIAFNATYKEPLFTLNSKKFNLFEKVINKSKKLFNLKKI